MKPKCLELATTLLLISAAIIVSANAMAGEDGKLAIAATVMSLTLLASAPAHTNPVRAGSAVGAPPTTSIGDSPRVMRGRFKQQRDRH